GRDGLFYSMWYPLLSVSALPLVGVGSFAGRLFSLPESYAAATFATLLSPIVTAATALFVALLAIRLGATIRGALLAALAFAFGTIALVYSRTFFADPLLALLSIGGIYFAVGDRPSDAIACAVAAFLAVLAKPTGIVVGPCVGAYL